MFLFEGDEIGMVDTPLELEQLKDPVGIRFYPYDGRDPVRTPMQWANVPGAGFTDAGVEPWLPFGDLSCNVADQRDDPESFLSLCRDVIAVRDAFPDLQTGGFESIDAPDGVLAYRRGERTLIALAIGRRTDGARRRHRHDPRRIPPRPRRRTRRRIAQPRPRRRASSSCWTPRCSRSTVTFAVIVTAFRTTRAEGDS